MLKPVDATTTPAWTKLTALHDSFTPDLRGAFETDPERAQRYGFELGDLYVDLSKNFLTDDVRDALARNNLRAVAITPEIYPTSVRGAGAGAAAGFGRIASILAPLSVPFLLERGGGEALVFRHDAGGRGYRRSGTHAGILGGGQG